MKKVNVSMFSLTFVIVYISVINLVMRHFVNGRVSGHQKPRWKLQSVCSWLTNCYHSGFSVHDPNVASGDSSPEILTYIQILFVTSPVG